MKTEISRVRNPKQVSAKKFNSFLDSGEIPFVECGTVLDTRITPYSTNEQNETEIGNIYIESVSFEYLVGWLTETSCSNFGLYRVDIRKCVSHNIHDLKTKTLRFNDLESTLSELDSLTFHPKFKDGKLEYLYTNDYKIVS